jgi:predicted phosphate transport protein (TIGR00153 family)
MRASPDSQSSSKRHKPPASQSNAGHPMLSWFRAIMPKEDAFFDMFERHSRVLVAGADALAKLLEGGPDVPARCLEVKAHENEADAITEEVFQAVRRSFITPFDRVDIKDLIQSMDDAIDQMHQTAKAITLYEVTEFQEPMRAMAAIAVESARLTVEAVPLLRKIGANASALSAYAAKITELEGRADDLHDQGVKALFLAHRHTDPMAFTVGAEIYKHLERVADRFEDVANEISGIVIEHV